jgi:lipopolysaccharide/colanic/teichoic acid biosynthesis glycosyltransferase
VLAGSSRADAADMLVERWRHHPDLRPAVIAMGDLAVAPLGAAARAFHDGDALSCMSDIGTRKAARAMVSMLSTGDAELTYYAAWALTSLLGSPTIREDLEIHSAGGRSDEQAAAGPPREGRPAADIVARVADLVRATPSAEFAIGQPDPQFALSICTSDPNPLDRPVHQCPPSDVLTETVERLTDGYVHMDERGGIWASPVNAQDSPRTYRVTGYRGLLLHVLLRTHSLSADDLFDLTTGLADTFRDEEVWAYLVRGLPTDARLVLLNDLAVVTARLSRRQAVVKRAVDMVVSAILLTLMSPLLLTFAIAIRLGSRGPAIYRHTRVGRYGRAFTTFKLRTMVVGADSVRDALRSLNEAQGGLFHIDEDPRVTRVGRFLRRTSLDELPMLLNVLRGDISLVGPVSQLLAETDMFDGVARTRLQIRPGMTGPAQLFASRRWTPASIQADLGYATSWSLWGDFVILARTVSRILTRRDV